MSGGLPTAAQAEQNTSATGGFINPRPPHPVTGDALQRALQNMCAVLADLPGDLVRPRWQPMPPVQPDASVTWAGIGVTQFDADEYPSIVHVSDKALPGLPLGYDILQRHVTLTVMVSFYGPEADDAAGQFRDSLYIPQNYEPVLPIGLKLRTIHDLARSPELINQQFVNRVDLRLEFRAQTNRRYPVLNLIGADVDLHSDTAEVAVSLRPGMPPPQGTELA